MGSSITIFHVVRLQVLDAKGLDQELCHLVPPQRLRYHVKQKENARAPLSLEHQKPSVVTLIRTDTSLS